MAENETARRRGRRAPDPIALLIGIAALVVAGAGMAGLTPGAVLDVRWLVAGAAVLAGALFLFASLRNSRGPSGE